MLPFPSSARRTWTASWRGGILAPVKVGDILFAQGDRNFCFYVILEGAVEILEHASETPHVVTTHRAGQFTGDIDTLTGRVALVTARVVEAGQVAMLSTTELRKAIDEMPEVGDVIVKAFLTRRRMLVDAGFVGVTIIGSRFSPASHRLRDFAVRNLVPIRWMDLDSDVQAEEMLRTLGFSAADTPIVIGSRARFIGTRRSSSSPAAPGWW